MLAYFKNYLFMFGSAGSSLLHGLFSLRGERGLLSGCSGWPSHCSSFSCGSQTLGCRGFSSCGSQAYLLHGIWDLSRSGLEPVSPALEGGFFTTEPQGCLKFARMLVHSTNIY